MIISCLNFIFHSVKWKGVCEFVILERNCRTIFKITSEDFLEELRETTKNPPRSEAPRLPFSSGRCFWNNGEKFSARCDWNPGTCLLWNLLCYACGIPFPLCDCMVYRIAGLPVRSPTPGCRRDVHRTEHPGQHLSLVQWDDA